MTTMYTATILIRFHTKKLCSPNAGNTISVRLCNTSGALNDYYARSTPSLVVTLSLFALS